MSQGPKDKNLLTDEQQKAKALSRWENEGGAKQRLPKRPQGTAPAVPPPPSKIEPTPSATNASVVHRRADKL